MKQTKLPLLRTRGSNEIILLKKEIIEDAMDDIIKIIENEQRPENLIEVPKKLSIHHPLVQAKQKNSSSSLKRRRNKLFSVILFALEDRGFEIEDINDNCVYKIHHEKESAYIELIERIIKHKRQLTEQEKTKLYNNQKWGYDVERTGTLKLTLYSYYGGYYSSQIKYFTDKKDKPLENILNDVVIEITKYIYKKKDDRLKWEEKERLYKEEKLRQEREREKRQNLLQETNDWVQAKILESMLMLLIAPIKVINV